MPSESGEKIVCGLNIKSEGKHERQVDESKKRILKCLGANVGWMSASEIRINTEGNLSLTKIGAHLGELIRDGVVTARGEIGKRGKGRREYILSSYFIPEPESAQDDQS
jgi:hypothetical protein